MLINPAEPCELYIAPLQNKVYEFYQHRASWVRVGIDRWQMTLFYVNYTMILYQHHTHQQPSPLPPSPFNKLYTHLRM